VIFLQQGSLIPARKVRLSKTSGRSPLQVGFSPMGESTLLPIVRVADAKVIFRAVALSAPTRLSDDQKLETLRRLDRFRQWPSLDEKRYCLVCGKVITGRQIQVTDGTRGNGPLRLSCPTEGCNSIAMDWVLPTNEVLARLNTLTAEERKASVLKPVAVTNRTSKTVRVDEKHERFVSRLRTLAFHLQRHS
jgi:hypothetical protein